MKTKNAAVTGSGDTVDRPAYLASFAEHVMVECPKCKGLARVACVGLGQGTPTLRCSSCGFSRSGWPRPKLPELKRSAKHRRCSRCNAWLGRARVRWAGDNMNSAEMFCTCGARADIAVSRPGLRFRQGVDPYFGCQLWLHERVGANKLWLYNEQHLHFIRDFVGASLRTRVPNCNGSIASRLPKWIKRASMRAPVLKALSRLQERVPRGSSPAEASPLLRFDRP